MSWVASDPWVGALPWGAHGDPVPYELGQYQCLIDMVADLIQQEGALFTFTRYSDGSYNTATGSLTRSTSTYTAYAVRIEDVIDDLSGTTQEAGGFVLWALPETYAVGDMVYADDRYYKIVEVKPLRPDNTDIVYQLMVKY